ncbi:putative cleavage induced protein [Phytophthora megakarya]|uniref:Putative cleavage induced protein n=1 Tax=Phytophthora megakarya TaxID=4795 RepID=A0A225WEG1_9STRA|nr:putative cleavage induced protein [Phytophthora megakarya]
MFTPVYFVLCTSRTETTYNDILHLISRDTGKKMTPAEIVCDFEFGLISAVQQAFPNAEVVGCFFHFKQALSRRMKFEHITKKEISIAMTPGCLDILAVIDPEFIDPKGIAWVKLEIKRQCATKGCAYSTRQWRSFWRYFHRIWLGKYSVSEWNVFGIANTIVARTNNPLERFNREMNAAFKPHPSLRHFVATIAKMSTGYARKMSNITRDCARKRSAYRGLISRCLQTLMPSKFPLSPTLKTSSSDEDDILDGSSDDDLPSGEVVVESLDPEIEQQAWLHENNIGEFSTRAMDYSAKFDLLNIVSYLLENRIWTGYSTTPIRTAASRGDVKLLQRFYQNGFETPDWFLKHDYISSQLNLAELASLKTKVPLLRWLAEDGLPVTLPIVSSWISESDRVQIVLEELQHEDRELVSWIVTHTRFESENSRRIICDGVQYPSRKMELWFQESFVDLMAHK